jgi:hypothetical protein
MAQTTVVLGVSGSIAITPTQAAELKKGKTLSLAIGGGGSVSVSPVQGSITKVTVSIVA